MGKKSSGSSSTYTDPNLETAYRKEAELAEKQQDWYLNEIYPWVRQQVEQSTALSQTNRDLALQDYEWWRNYNDQALQGLSNKAQEYYNRWKESYLPVEQQLISQANMYLDDTFQAQQAQLATGLVNQQYDAQRQANMMNMAQYGVNANAAMYNGFNRAQTLQQQSAAAAAANQARDAAQQSGWEKLTQLSALGQSYLSGSNAASMTATGGAATSSALGSNSQAQSQQAMNNTVANVANYNQIGLNSYQSLQNAWGQYGQQALSNTNQVRQAQDAASAANAQKSAARSSAIGTVAGAAMMAAATF